MICFFSSGNHRPIWHWLAMLRSWGLCPRAPGVYRFGLMGRDMTCGMPRPGYWPFGIVRRSGCPPAEPYPAYDALSSLVKRWVPVTFRNRNQKSGFAPIQCPVLLRQKIRFCSGPDRRNELGMHLSVMHAVDCAIAKSEAGRQAGVWPLLRGAHESRRGGMVDATDLKSVEGQPSWGFESPRRHMGCHLQSPQNPQSVLRCRPMGIVGDWNQFFHAALADQ